MDGPNELMRPTLPSITALRVFESAARHLTCTEAANELFLTQSAVSKQLRGLEDCLGVMLFHRVNRGLVLTELGRDYLEEIRPVLEQLAAASARLSARQIRSVSLKLHILAIVGDRWLLPRFSQFAAEHPEIDVQFTNQPSAENPQSAEPVVSFLHGDGSWPGYVSDYLFGRELVVVASPATLARLPAPFTPADVCRLPLLNHVEVPDAWRDFHRAHGLEPAASARQVQCEFYTTMLKAAIGGLGVALVPRVFAVEEVGRGELVDLPGIGVTSRLGYHLAIPEHRQADPAVATFRAWVLRAAEQTRRSMSVPA
jgi:DNA-binding transcriptional LysR family regulator